MNLIIASYVVASLTSNSGNIGRCVDGAIFIVSGIAILIIAPHQIRRRIQSGKLDERKAKWKSKLVWPAGCITIGYGLLKIFFGY